MSNEILKNQRFIRDIFCRLPSICQQQINGICRLPTANQKHGKTTCIVTRRCKMQIFFGIWIYIFKKGGIFLLEDIFAQISLHFSLNSSCPIFNGYIFSKKKQVLQICTEEFCISVKAKKYFLDFNCMFGKFYQKYKVIHCLYSL